MEQKPLPDPLASQEHRANVEAPLPEVLALATAVYEGLDVREIDEIETIASDRRAFFVSDDENAAVVRATEKLLPRVWPAEDFSDWQPPG